MRVLLDCCSLIRIQIFELWITRKYMHDFTYSKKITDDSLLVFDNLTLLLYKYLPQHYCKRILSIIKNSRGEGKIGKYYYTIASKYFPLLKIRGKRKSERALRRSNPRVQPSLIDRFFGFIFFLARYNCAQSRKLAFHN